MTDWVKRVITKAVLLLCGIALASPVFSDMNDSSQKPTHNRYNIVLAVDASGSMSDTDPNGLRFEAIGKFVALLAERGNTIGTVVFSDGVTLQRPMTAADGIQIKRGIVDEISGINPLGYTNIGGALSAAADILGAQGADPALPSIILLLSDGNTEMPTEEAKTLSLSQKADAIQRARDAGYVIHSVSLNADGTASPDELSQISNATGGLFEEVKTAADLENVYDMFYRVIFNSLDYKNNQTAFPESGVVEGAFQVPAIGVEEINLILSGLAKDYSLTDPNGNAYTKDALAGSTYSSETFSVVKFTDPVPGEWTYSVSGVPGDLIRIELIFNTDLKAQLTAVSADGQSEYRLNAPIAVTALLAESGAGVINPDLYTGFTAAAIIGEVGKETTLEMPLTADGFICEFTPQDSGAYTVKARVEGFGYILDTETVAFNVNNTPPVFQEHIEHKVYLLPFSDNTSRIDLSPAVSDPLGRPLRFEPLSASYNADEYSIEGNELVMRSYSLSKGSFEIAAVDPLGGSVSFNVYVTTVNVTMWTVILLGAGGFAVIVILGVIVWLNLNKRFYGICYVQYFDRERDDYFEEIAVSTPKRGKRRLPSRKLPNNTGFNLNKCFFQASGKRHVTLRMNELVFGQGVKDKKFKIDGEGFPVQISKGADSTKGLTVRFETGKANAKRGRSKVNRKGGKSRKSGKGRYR